MKHKWIKTAAVAVSYVAAVGVLHSATTLSDNRLQFYRPSDKTGINVFETFRQDAPTFDGLVVRVGGHFTQQLQWLDHRNTALPVFDLDGVNVNELKEIGLGFNLATANLNLDAQLADGIRMNLVSYLSSRHHPETWVKAGYVQIDRAPFFNSETIDSIMEFLSVRIGHMEVNYGDMHLRRTDNANAMYNPFVGNLIMDAFATEIGAEVYAFTGDVFGMIGITGGEIRGGVDNPDSRSPSIYGKVGIDRQMNEDLRVRLTGSIYTTSSSVNNTLYGGDRSGSRFYYVLENTQSSVSTNFTSGRFNPGFRDKVTAMVFNPFVKFGGWEFFGNIETASGRAANESSSRRWNQYAVEVIHRFFENESLYAGARWNLVEGELPQGGGDASIDRLELGGGWFLNDYMLLKAEYVVQNYDDFPATDIRNGGKFDGFMLEAVVGF
jgi:hypothetical protein